MSEPGQDGKAEPADDAGGVIPVEVEAPDPPAADPAPAPDPVAELETKLAAAEKEKKDNWDRYLRAAADLENLRKRTKRELDDARFDTKNKVLKEMLPVVDNLERALEHAAADPRTIVEGIQAVQQQALGVLTSLGFPRRDDTGATFDPARHEAVAATYDPRVPPGTVVQVVRPGYGEPDHQLRPAQVVVAKAD